MTIKKSFLIMLTGISLILSGCSQSYTPLEKLPEDYSIELAKKDNCVIFGENGEFISGEDVWHRFLEKTSASGQANVRLVQTLSISLLDEQDQNPRLWIEDLNYNGKTYTLSYIDDGEIITKTYTYLKKFEGKVSSPSALSENYTIYALVNDDNLTWEDLESSLLSSREPYLMDCHIIYMSFD